MKKDDLPWLKFHRYRDSHGECSMMLFPLHSKKKDDVNGYFIPDQEAKELFELKEENEMLLNQLGNIKDDYDKLEKENK